jgi:hypothetical protein
VLRKGRRAEEEDSTRSHRRQMRRGAEEGMRLGGDGNREAGRRLGGCREEAGRRLGRRPGGGR